MIEIGTRVEIVGGEHFAREGTVAGHKTVRGLDCISVRLDRPLPDGDRVVVVLAEHIAPAL